MQNLINCSVPVCARTKNGGTTLDHAAAFGQSQVLGTLVKVRCQPVNGSAGALSMVRCLVASAGSWNMFGRGDQEHHNAHCPPVLAETFLDIQGSSINPSERTHPEEMTQAGIQPLM